MRGPVHLLDHLVGICDAGEDEVVVVAGGGVEVHVADLKQALKQPTATPITATRMTRLASVPSPVILVTIPTAKAAIRTTSSPLT